MAGHERRLVSVIVICVLFVVFHQRLYSSSFCVLTFDVICVFLCVVTRESIVHGLSHKRTQVLVPG